MSSSGPKLEQRIHAMHPTFIAVEPSLYKIP